MPVPQFTVMGLTMEVTDTPVHSVGQVEIILLQYNSFFMIYHQVMDLLTTKLLIMVPAMINMSLAVTRDTRQVFSDAERRSQNLIIF